MATPENPIVPAAAVVQETQTPADDKNTQKDGAVREAAHAAAEVEADAVAAAAAAEREAEKLRKDVGENAANKWLEKKFAEIEASVETKTESLKQWLEDRLKAVEGKKKEPTEESPAAPAAAAPAASSATPTKKRRRI
jgi:phosphoglycolate phosphatase-like HAD superfamily hydrolase